MTEIEKKMITLMAPIDRQIMLCDDQNDILLLACGMLQTVKDIFDNQLGPEGRNEMFQSMMEK